MKPPIPVILNGRAGGSESTKSIDDLRLLFQAAGIEAQWILAGDGEDIVELTRRALRDRPRMVVGGGGDGTINAVASALVGTEVALGVLPLGTLNHFAKDLGIPNNLEEAVRTLGSGDAAPIDVGEVNGRLFLNNSSLGLYPSLVSDRDRQQESLGRGKWPACLCAALVVLRRFPMLSVRVCVDGTEFVRRTPGVFVGNNVYQMEGLKIGLRACLDAGTLSLYMPRRGGRMGLIRIAFRALFGLLRTDADFEALVATEFRIETHHRSLQVATDGEVTETATPLHYKIRAGALRVIVPRRPN